MFNKSSIFKKTVLRLVFLLSATKRSGEHPRTPMGLVAWALYGCFRSRAFHEVWCPKVIGRDSWVWEATGVSVQSPPPKNWGKKLVVVRKRIARENGKSPEYVVFVVVVVVVVVHEYTSLGPAPPPKKQRTTGPSGPICSSGERDMKGPSGDGGATTRALRTRRASPPPPTTSHTYYIMHEIDGNP